MDLVEQLLAGNRRALARAITLVENRSPQAQEIVRRLHQRTGHAHTVGVTGSPGAGKSTLVAQLAKEFRRRGLTVGVIAVDPSSPFTHGAVLGDRVRMQDLTSDPEIFIRSMASREAIGGLAETTGEVVAVLDAFGKDVIIVETVGAGQDEVEIARLAQTTLVIGTPGTGDEIQTMKAGILEIADIYVVNKADRDGADNLVSALEQLLSYAPAKGRKVPVVRTIATEDKGTAELVDAIQEHWRFLEESGLSKKDELERTRYRLLGLVRQEVFQTLEDAAHADNLLAETVHDVANRELDPYTAAERLLTFLAAKLESRDPYTRGHSQRVRDYCRSLARHLGLDSEQVRLISQAALLHDLGKADVPDAILLKPGPLTRDEWIEVTAHSIRSAELARRLGFSESVQRIVRSHHEWFDGMGYPDNLAGEEIPLGARMLAVADGYDTVTTRRPYRPAFNRHEALKMLNEGSGRQWDPQVVEAFVRVLAAGAETAS